MKKAKQGKWKPVQLTDDLLSKNIDDLVGIEELTDYSLIVQQNGKQKKVKNSKVSPRISENHRDNFPKKRNDKATKRKRRRNKNVNEPHEKKMKVDVQEDTEDEVENVETEPDVDKITGWKPVQLTEGLLSKNIDGLVGIEELTDYSVVSSVQQNKKKKSKKKVNSKKPSSFPEEETKKKDNTVKRKRGRKKKLKEGSKMKECIADVERDEVIEENVESESDLLDKMSVWSKMGVASPILKALSELGFIEPTEIQARALPAAIMGRRDILGAAETGSGKTLAFGIPILQHIMNCKNSDSSREVDTQSDEDMEEHKEEEIDIETDEEENEVEEETLGINCVKVINNVEFSKPVNDSSETKLYALVLTPTRELALQVWKHLTAAAKYTGIKIAVLVGGMAVQKQERLLSRRPEIVVATPGRLWEIIQDGNPHLSQIHNIKYLAVDETDRMLEKGHFQELKKLFELLNVDGRQKKRRQNFVFSATLTLVHDIPQHLKGHKGKLKLTPGRKLQSIISTLGITNPKVVDITNDSGTAGTLTEARILCTLEEKDFYLYYFLQEHQGRTLVFCNSISSVRRLTQLLTLLKCQPLPLHANMMQRQRLKNLDRFRDNPCGVLLATDVAARGLDIPNVQYVVHYQVPRTAESYVHRSGRTARAQKLGLALLMMEPSEVPYYSQLCRTLGRSKDMPLFPVENNALEVVKKRVHLARECDKLELASRRSSSETGWFRKALKEMDMFIDEEDLPRQLNEDDCSRIRKSTAGKRKQLDAMLSKSLFTSKMPDTCLDFLKPNKAKKIC